MGHKDQAAVEDWRPRLKGIVVARDDHGHRAQTGINSAPPSVLGSGHQSAAARSTAKTADGGCEMPNPHMGVPADSGKRHLLRWLSPHPSPVPLAKANSVNPRARPETVRESLPEQHDHFGRNVKLPWSNAMGHHDASRECCPDLGRRDGRLIHPSWRCVHAVRRRRNSSACRCLLELRRVVRPTSSHRAIIATAHSMSDLFDLSATIPRSDTPLKPPLTVSSRRT